MVFPKSDNCIAFFLLPQPLLVFLALSFGLSPLLPPLGTGMEILSDSEEDSCSWGDSGTDSFASYSMDWSSSSARGKGGTDFGTLGLKKEHFFLFFLQSLDVYTYI